MSTKNNRPRSAYQRPYGQNDPSQPGGPRSPRRGRPFLWIAVALIAAGIVYAVTRNKPASNQTVAAPAATNKPPSPTPPAAPTTPTPRAEFARIFDFGRAAGDSLVDCLFTITNVGTAPLLISNVSPGCGCMRVGDWAREIAPGQSGSIPVKLDTRNYTGGFAKSVFMNCNDPSQPSVMLEIKGQIWRPIEITPPTAVINLTPETPSNSTSVRVLNHQEEPLLLSELRSTLTSLAVELQTNQPGKEYQINVRTVPPFPTMRQQGQISFKTSATNIPSTNLFAIVHYQPTVQAIPFHLRLPSSPLATEFTGMAWVRNHGTNPVSVTEAAVNVPGVNVTQEDDPPNRGIKLTLKFPIGFQGPPGTNAELVIKTTHPQHPELRVPILQPTPGR